MGGGGNLIQELMVSPRAIEMVQKMPPWMQMWMMQYGPKAMGVYLRGVRGYRTVMGTKKGRYTVYVLLLLALIYRYRGKKTRHPSADEEALGNLGANEKRRFTRKQFWRRLGIILPIVLPGIRSREFGLLAVHTGFLVARTLLSIYVATLDGRVVQAIVERDLSRFVKQFGTWFMVSVPATFTNACIRYLESRLAVRFRTRLSEHLYARYMENQTYYRVTTLDGRLSNPDQCLTEDVSRLGSHLAHLHSQLSKPLLDVILFSAQLWMMLSRKNGEGSGWAPAAIATVTIWATARILRWFAPPFGKLVARQTHLEGSLRFVHSRLLAHAEEIAFYGGEKLEASSLQRAYQQLTRHLNYMYKVSVPYNMLEGLLMKYVWSGAGMLMLALPAFANEFRSYLMGSQNSRVKNGLVDPSVIGSRTKDYITAKKLMIDGSDAIERMMLAYKEVTELDGRMYRIVELLDVFRDVREGRYQKEMVSAAAAEKVAAAKSAPSLPHLHGNAGASIGGGAAASTRVFVDMSQRGKVVEGDYIQFEDVPIVSPNGDVLVPKISFEIRPGMHLLIIGPNGCGKSSLFRILGGLWPVYSGTLIKPRLRNMFYIPQRPYLPIGDLRLQVIYPDTLEDMRSKGRTDADLDEIMTWVHLSYVVVREGGWDAVAEWKDVLSGGEKQRIAFARLCYHRPQFAILDECTSAVSVDVEGLMYAKAQELNITLLTVSHRHTLWKYHNYLLHLDGLGGWTFDSLNASERTSLREEKEKLESQLQGVSKMRERLSELCLLLGEPSALDSPTDKSAGH